MIKKPLLLLDIDEVISLDVYPLPPGFVNRRYRGFDIYINTRCEEWLHHLSRLYELIWCSTWENDANMIVGPALKLPRLPFIEFSTPVDGSMEFQTWKLPDVEKFTIGTPCAWIDDDIHNDAYEWARLRNTSGLPTLLIKPDPNIGMTEEDFHTLINFVEMM